MQRMFIKITKALRPIHRRIAAALPLRARRQYLYAANFGRLGRFSSPQTFNEKVNWRILQDHRPEIGLACDKLAMKQGARLRVPVDELRIPRTYWSGTDVTSIDWAQVPAEWVLKPNHGSGEVLLSPYPADQIHVLTRDWLKDNQHVHLGEWGYSQAAKVLVLEERIPSPSGQAPVDYKFLCFEGEPVLIQLSLSRFEDHLINYYDLDWNRVSMRTKYPNSPDDPPRPLQLDKMLSAARQLSAGWDFMRIDLYATESEVWFGEFSPYPGGGVDKFRPHSVDVDLGQQWRLPELTTTSNLPHRKPL